MQTQETNSSSSAHNLNVHRSELKYYINTNECVSLVNRLKYVLDADKHSVPGTGYFIRSLYFDSYDDKCLHEKQAGIMYRRKFRLRIYDTECRSLKFEIKNKCNNQIFKQSATISRDSAERIAVGEYDELLNYNNPVLNQAYIEFTNFHYRPTVLVDYDRDAYVSDYFNLRITIDKHLRSNNTDFDLFSSDVHMIPVILEGNHILEIKFDRCLPDHIRTIVQPSSFERFAISKYTLGRRMLKTQKWEDN
ncbi:MAG: polyphosphate polymerase domain-containing protein [Halioglobus sp.]|nr:polyphosphate polymerase domain-containing protein [Halioglobus sp.]